MVKRSGNFHSDVIGKRELFQWKQILVLQSCITVAEADRHLERAKESEREREDKLLEIDKVLPKHTLPPPLTFLLSFSLALSRSFPRSVFSSQMLCILDIGTEKFTVSREEI